MRVNDNVLCRGLRVGLEKAGDGLSTDLQRGERWEIEAAVAAVAEAIVEGEQRRANTGYE